MVNGAHGTGFGLTHIIKLQYSGTLIVSLAMTFEP